MPQGKDIPKRIAFITSSLTAGGAQGTIINLARYLSERDYHVDIILLRSGNDYGKDEINRRTINVITLLNLKKNFSSLILPFILVLLCIRLFRSIHKRRYLLLIGSHEYYPYYFTVLFAKLFRVKALLMIGSDLKKDMESSVLIGWLHLLFITLSIRFSHKLVCASRALAIDFKKNFKVPPQKVEMIYNGIDVNRIMNLSKKTQSAKMPRNEHVTSTIGRLIDQKGYVHLIRAFTLIHEVQPDTKLLIIGRGKLETKLKKLAQDLGVSKNVIFKRFMKGMNPYAYLSQSKLLIFSSISEGFGITILEAMACRLPVISTDCKYGPREILDDSFEYSKFNCGRTLFGKYGILVPVFPALKIKNYATHPIIFEEKILANTVLDLLNNEELLDHYRTMSLKRVMSFQANKMGEAYEKVIHDLIHSI